MINISDNKLLILLMLFLSGCSILEEASFPRYVLSVTGDALFGKDESVYNQDFIDQFPYTAINAQLNNGQNALMVLAYVRDGIYEYVSNDGIKFYFDNGLLIKSEGLNNDFKRNLSPNYLSLILDGNNNTGYVLSGTIDFLNPSAYELAMKSKLTSRKDEFIFNGALVMGDLVTETIKIPQIKRTFKNKYWLINNRIVKSEYNFPMNPRVNLFEVKK